MSTSLKILMVAPQPYFSPRGTPFSVLHRIRALLELGHKVDLVTYGYGEDIPMEGLKIIRTRRLPFIKQIKIGPSIAKIFLDILLYFKTRKILKQGSYDVFHSHEEASFFALSLLRNKNVLHLYDMHSSLPLQLSNFKAFDLALFKKFFDTAENKVLDTCDAVITICDELAVIVNERCPDKPHKMIENIGDDRKVFTANSTNWKDKLNITSSKILIYTGTFEAYQGIDLLLESMTEVVAAQPNIVLVLVGGNPSQIEHYKQESRKLNLIDHVRFTGTVHPENIPGLINMSTAIVSPRSRGTNTPLKIYNYLRTGKPLIATDRLTHTQILNETITCLVKPTKTEFAAGILKVIENPEYAEELSDKARQFSEQNFSDENYIKMVDDIVKQLVESKHVT